MPDSRITSLTAIDLLKSFEGLRLASYQDGAGICTIGYGHTKGATEGQVITELEAESMLREDLKMAETAINQSVHVAITQHQFDAMACFAFNVGCAAFRQSSVLRLLNSGNSAWAAESFLKWNKIRVNGELAECPGLTRRREAERNLFLTPEGEVCT